ncbi:MAG: redoxin domain-containing protein [Pseudomonadota bacterium]
MRIAHFLTAMVTAASIALVIVPAQAQSLPTDRGPALGQVVEFTAKLDAHDGGQYALADLAGPKGTALFFNRSLDWCPFCQKQTEDLIKNSALLTDAGYGIAVVTYDSPAKLKKFAVKQNPSFPLLSDTGSANIIALGLLNEKYKPGSFAYGIPHPMIIVIGTDGAVKAKFAEEGYKVRPVLQDVVRQLKNS